MIELVGEMGCDCAVTPAVLPPVFCDVAASAVDENRDKEEEPAAKTAGVTELQRYEEQVGLRPAAPI